MIRKNLKSRVSSRNSNRRLYESIMRDVAKTIKRHLNEKAIDKNAFYDDTMAFYDEWLDNLCQVYINDLIHNGEIYNGMDWMDAWDILENKFMDGLANAVGGNWWDVGKQCGYTDEQLDNIYNDKMQAKTDIFSAYVDEDDEDLVSI